MSKVRLEFLSWLANGLGVNGKNEEVILASIEVDSTVRDLFNQLVIKYPHFGQFVFEVKAQKLNEGVNIFLNGSLLELFNGLQTKLKDGDILTMVPTIVGG